MKNHSARRCCSAPSPRRGARGAGSNDFDAIERATRGVRDDQRRGRRTQSSPTSARPYGTLQSPHKYATGGRGSGGTVDPLGSQGSLTLSEDGSFLFAPMPAAATCRCSACSDRALLLSDRAPSGGSEPNAVAQHGKTGLRAQHGRQQQRASAFASPTASSRAFPIRCDS